AARQGRQAQRVSTPELLCRFSSTSRAPVETGSLALSPNLVLRRLRGRLSLAGSQHGKGVERLDPRRDEKQKFARTLCRVCVLEQISDQRKIPEARHLPNVDRIGVDQNSSNDGGSSVRYQHLSLRGLSGDRRHTVNRPCKIRLAVGDVRLEQNRSGLRDLRSYAEV